MVSILEDYGYQGFGLVDLCSSTVSVLRIDDMLRAYLIDLNVKEAFGQFDFFLLGLY